ncbi:MAG: HEAT repeat domain-containing protein, partial [Myxococcota bacterium]
GAELNAVAKQLVGPVPPEKAADAKDWPEESAQSAMLNVLVNALASDDPTQRYASARVLSRRAQPKAFWREAERLARPSLQDEPWIPRTSWDDEVIQPRKKDWVRRMFRAAPTKPEEGSKVKTWVRRLLTGGRNATPFGTPPSTSTGAPYQADVLRMVFGTYSGLVRQSPPPGDADETHRVHRDSVARLGALAKSPEVGEVAVLPILRRALSDPHHLVRKAAVQALADFYPEGSLEPLALALASPSADIGQAAVADLVVRAEQGDADARTRALAAIDAPAAAVRAFALGRLPRLFDKGSLEPWFLALGSKYADVRLSVVERLVDSQDERVFDALSRALESDHEDLRLKAALALAKRGDLRTLDVLAGFLRSENDRTAAAALTALVELPRVEDADARSASSAKVAAVVSARLEDDPDQTANRSALIAALGALKSPAGVATLLTAAGDDDASIRQKAFDALILIATPDGMASRKYPDGAVRRRYDESRMLEFLPEVATSLDASLRASVADVCADIDADGAETLLARLLEDRETEVRVAAAERMATRLKYVETASTTPLKAALRLERRELVLPAALGLAYRQQTEAFQPLMLVFKAGLPEERERAVVGLGTLGDPRALEELYRLVDPDADLIPEDRALAPAAAEALGAVLPALTDVQARSQAREALDRLATNGDSDVRIGALAGLRRVRDEPSRGLLERLVADGFESIEIRRAAVQEVAKWGAAASETVLAETLNAPHLLLRNDALVALKRILPDARTKVSLLALQSRYADIAQPAALFLARHGDPETLVSRIAEIKDRRVRRRVRQGLIRRQAYASTALPALL